jgi:hypothetical protein
MISASRQIVLDIYKDYTEWRTSSAKGWRFTWIDWKYKVFYHTRPKKRLLANSVHPDDHEKIAFVTHGGLYEFNRMPFALATAPTTFQRAMEQALAGLTYSICLCYLDDIIIFSNSITEHWNRLRAVLTRFRQYDLRLNLAKCNFAAKKVHYLRHMISDDGVSPHP